LKRKRIPQPQVVTSITVGSVLEEEEDTSTALLNNILSNRDGRIQCLMLGIADIESDYNGGCSSRL
jgi:hypothetical protein